MLFCVYVRAAMPSFIMNVFVLHVIRTFDFLWISTCIKRHLAKKFPQHHFYSNVFKVIGCRVKVGPLSKIRHTV